MGFCPKYLVWMGCGLFFSFWSGTTLSIHQIILYPGSSACHRPVAGIYNCLLHKRVPFFFKERVSMKWQKEERDILKQIHIWHRAWWDAQCYNPDIMTCAEVKSGPLKWLKYPGNTFFFFYKSYFLSNVYTQWGAWSHNPEIQSHGLHCLASQLPMHSPFLIHFAWHSLWAGHRARPERVIPTLLTMDPPLDVLPELTCKVLLWL